MVEDTFAISSPNCNLNCVLTLGTFDPAPLLVVVLDCVACLSFAAMGLHPSANIEESSEREELRNRLVASLGNSFLFFSTKLVVRYSTGPA